MSPKVFKPRDRSLLGAFLWALFPAVIGISLAYFGYQRAGWFVLLVAGLACLLSLFVIIASLHVHTKSISLDERTISTSFFPGGGTRMLWSSIVAATLRERRSAAFRTERFLTLESSDGRILIYNPSV